MAKVRADDCNPITRGDICNKGFSVPSYTHHGQRVEHPLRRRADGSFERIDWETAARHEDQGRTPSPATSTQGPSRRVRAPKRSASQRFVRRCSLSRGTR
jgi:anaerobic selenocysteine-containing dehydrogenase